MDLTQFTQQYSLQKTIRFELKPVGETADYIKDYGSDYLKQEVFNSEERQGNYQIVKALLDEMHREYIEERLSSLAMPSTGELVINPDDLEHAFIQYRSFLKDKAEQKNWENTLTALRKKLVKAFSTKTSLFGKDAITKTLPDFLKATNKWHEEKNVVLSFAKFTSYFSGFNENRENMYKDADQITAIANRTINQNLVKFFDNILHFKTLQQNHSDLIFELEDDTVLNNLGITNIAQAFEPAFYLKLCSQTGITHYKQLFGSKKTSDSDGYAGLNQQINAYRQKKQLKPRELTPFIQLHKQILSNEESQSFRYQSIESDQALLEEIGLLIDELSASEGHLAQLSILIEGLHSADASKTYIKRNAIGSLSNDWLGHHSILPTALFHWAESHYSTAAQRNVFLKRDDKGVYSITEVQNALANYITSLEDGSNEKTQLEKALLEKGASINAYFIKQANALDEAIQSLIESVLPLTKLTELDKNRRPPQTHDKQDQGGSGFHQVLKIQNLLDAYIKHIGKFRPLHCTYKGKAILVPEQDMEFYSPFSTLMETIESNVRSTYNRARNHLSKKPFKTDKFKINFENPNLMSGWDANKEEANSSILFEKEGNYYLGIMHPKHRQLFNYGINIDDNEKKVREKKALSDEICVAKGRYRKVVYKLLPGASKMLPKVFFSKSRINFFAPSDEVLRIRNTASHTRNGTPQKGFSKADFNLNDCHQLINFFKQSIEKHHDWRQFNFTFSDTKTYSDISDFYREVESQGYKIHFDHIKENYIDQCVAEGKLFLFQIYNKDFSPKSTGTPNLHTLYWRGLFEQTNLDNVVLKLNGEAEMFFRPHSLKKNDVAKHQKNTPIKQKNGNNESLFPYTIHKDKRYTKDKFFFHVPISFNFKAQTKYRFNDAINRAITKNTHVIGIDRGERQLLYYCVINPQGDIIENGQKSLNQIGATNYHQKLDEREKQRDQARKSWTSVETIKDLKQGYLSHVVHEITELVVKYNAIVCLEDLNQGFKRGRFKVEKQVYQKFEKALIDKLNYLVRKKETNPNKAGHYLNAYQLTAPFESFEKMGKQTGIIYYVRADYTSKICPVTGFVNLLRPAYKNREQAKQFLSSFSEIRFNPQADYFEFTFDYKLTNPSTKLGKAQTQWRACSIGQRLQNKKSEHGWETVQVCPTTDLKTLFEKHQIDYSHGDNLLDNILAHDDASFFSSLLWSLKMTLQMRNSRTGTDEDYMVSPVCDKNGYFYDSRTAADNLPKDADANGAYHIALKGLWNVQQITQHNWEEEKPKPVNLNMKNEQWFEYANVKTFKN